LIGESAAPQANPCKFRDGKISFSIIEANSNRVRTDEIKKNYDILKLREKKNKKIFQI